MVNTVVKALDREIDVIFRFNLTVGKKRSLGNPVNNPTKHESASYSFHQMNLTMHCACVSGLQPCRCVFESASDLDELKKMVKRY